MCILTGCDYLDPIQKVGPHTALKLIREHGSLDAVVTAIQNNAEPKYVMQKDRSYADARDFFLNPDVALDLDTDFNWERPDIDVLVRYLVVEKGFYKERVRE